MHICAGEAVSNAVQATVGELAWASVATACSWKNDSSGEVLRLFDPDLTARGRRQVFKAPVTVWTVLLYWEGKQGTNKRKLMLHFTKACPPTPFYSLGFFLDTEYAGSHLISSCQVDALAAALDHGDVTFQDLIGRKPYKAIFSPLTRQAYLLELTAFLHSETG